MAGAAGGQDEKIEQLYVTATKREESLQEVPISMAALDASFLEASGITQFGQLQRVRPQPDHQPGHRHPRHGHAHPGHRLGRKQRGDRPERRRLHRRRLPGPRGHERRRPARHRARRGAAGAPGNPLRQEHRRRADQHHLEAARLRVGGRSSKGVFGNYANYEGRASVNYPHRRRAHRRAALRLPGRARRLRQALERRRKGVRIPRQPIPFRSGPIQPRSFRRTRPRTTGSCS